MGLERIRGVCVIFMQCNPLHLLYSQIHCLKQKLENVGKCSNSTNNARHSYKNTSSTPRRVRGQANKSYFWPVQLIQSTKVGIFCIFRNYHEHIMVCQQ